MRARSRRRRGELDELVAQVDQGVAIAADLFTETESLREVVTEIRDDPRPAEAHNELLVELRRIAAAVEQLVARGGVR